jgi:hypothetical protein
MHTSSRGVLCSGPTRGVKEDVEKIARNMKLSLRDCENLWKIATMQEDMTEKTLDAKWFGEDRNLRDLEDDINPYIRDKKSEGAEVFIFLKVNDQTEPLVVTYTNNNFNILNTQHTPWSWLSKTEYASGNTSIPELVEENDETWTSRFKWARKALILTIKPTEGSNDLNTRRRLQFLKKLSNNYMITNFYLYANKIQFWKRERHNRSIICRLSSFTVGKAKNLQENENNKYQELQEMLLRF